jgi:hypothetical protein
MSRLIAFFLLFFEQVEYVRDMEREVEYMRTELANIEEIRKSLPDFCPKSQDLCLEC